MVLSQQAAVFRKQARVNELYTITKQQTYNISASLVNTAESEYWTTGHLSGCQEHDPK